MGVTKTLISPGDGVTKPKNGDNITMEYTGWLQDTSAANGKGKQCVSTSQIFHVIFDTEQSQVRLLRRPR